MWPPAWWCGGHRDFVAQVADGRLLEGQHDTYHGNQPLTYGCDPAENVVFNGCHDNETIFDQGRPTTPFSAQPSSIQALH